ncbi:hypothetical protein ACK337_19550 [Aeromonas veronii]
MADVFQNPIFISVIGAVIGGLILSPICYKAKKHIKERAFQVDEAKIFEFIRNSSYRYKFRSTEAISSATNLTRARVEEVATNSDRIIRNGKEKETWRLAE